MQVIFAGGFCSPCVGQLGTSRSNAIDIYDVARRRHPGPTCLLYPFVRGKGVLNGYSSTHVSLWDSLMFGRLAMDSLLFGRVLEYSPPFSRQS